MAIRISDSGGFSLVEIIVALTLFALVSSASLRTLVSTRRTYTRQIERLAVNGDLRVGMALIARELRGLDTTDSTGSDILSIGPNLIEYSAMRALGFACLPGTAGERSVTVWSTPAFGAQRWDPTTDSLFVYLRNGQWARRDMITVVPGRDCPGGKSSFKLELGQTPGPIEVGTPVRSFEGYRLRLYRRDGFWLGGSRRKKNGGWTRIQPILGPLARDGFLLSAVADFSGLSMGDTTPALDVRLISGGNAVVDTLRTSINFRNSAKSSR